MIARSVLAALFVLIIINRTVTADCTPKRNVKAGTANQGGFEFEYESWEGDHCVQYRIRNKPGSLLTPVKWTYGDAVFIDTELLPCSISSRECPPSDKVDHAYDFDHPKTRIGYGVNKDQYTEKPDTDVKSQIGQASNFGSATTSFAGAVSDSDNKPAIVTMGFEPFRRTKEGKWVVRISASQTSTGHLASSEPIEVTWGTSEKVLFTKTLKPGKASSWEYTIDEPTLKCDPAGGIVLLRMRQDDKLLATTNTLLPCKKTDADLH